MRRSAVGSRAAAIFTCALLIACARQGPPAPLTGAPPPVAAPVADIIEAGGRVVVHHGQTLYAVARGAGVPLRSLIDANHLHPPYHIHTGEVLIIPPVHGHLVQRGETLYGVARHYGVEAATLVQLNHLAPPYRLRIGELLTLPPPVAAVSSPDFTPPPETTAAAPVAPEPMPAQVMPLDSTAPSPAVALAPLPTEELSTPAAATANTPPPAPKPITAPVPLAPTVNAAPPPVALPPPNASEARVAALVADHDPPVAPLFYWPVRGRVIAVFGPGPGGTHNDGINIAAPTGTIVNAAESGTVAYAGDGLKGFGNLLLIKHPGGWMSAYAHNDVLLVKQGDRVRRGQPVAQVGATGDVSTPQLHFELRDGVKPVDPLDHLPQLVGGNG